MRGEFSDPKSADSGRSVPMAERVAVGACGAARALPVTPVTGDLVFCHPETGKPLDRSKLVRRFKQALERADVHRITFHELRHTFGTRMAASGAPMRTLQHWMGHADSKTTQIYAHYQPERPGGRRGRSGVRVSLGPSTAIVDRLVEATTVSGGRRAGDPETLVHLDHLMPSPSGRAIAGPARWRLSTSQARLYPAPFGPGGP